MNYRKCKRDKVNNFEKKQKRIICCVKIALFKTNYPFHLLFYKVKMGGVQSFTKGFLNPHH